MYPLLRHSDLKFFFGVVKIGIKTIINHTTYLLLEPKHSVCSLTNLPLLLQKPLHDVGAAILLLFPGLVIHLQQDVILLSLVGCFFSSPITKCKSSDQKRSSSISSQWLTEALLALFYPHCCFCTKIKFSRNFSWFKVHLSNELIPLTWPSSQARVTTKKSLQSCCICWEILKWWELGQIHSQQTIPLCPPCRSSTSLFSSRCWCQCAPPPPSQKNLFTDVGAGLLVHLLVPVIHLQQEAMRWL